jgi:HlyD family secretion protein
VSVVGDKPLLTPTGKWIVGGAVIVALGLAALSVLQLQNRPKPQSSPAVTTTKATTADIAALGRIEPAGEVIKVGGPSGERIGKLLVQEGQSVTSGQPIAYLESYGERLADRDVASSQLKDGLAQIDSEQRYGDTQVAEARTRISQADAPKLQESSAQKATLNRIKAELAIVETDVKRFRQLKDSGAVSQKELDDKRSALETKTGELREAEAQLERIQQERRTNVDNASAQVRAAQAEQQRSRSQIQIATARSNLNLAQVRLDRTIIRAPRSGQILNVLKREGEALEVSAGTTSNDGGGIVELGNTTQMYVVAEVYETDIGRVRVGQPAVITSSAFPGKISGVVERIGLRIGKNDVISTDPAANTDTRVVEVKIRLLNSRPVANFTNLQVKVAIRPRT